ncbi:hypothetical protein GCM10010266_59030 [Streptomyces griseomycini]|nr:hypothetical protein GCM10010266_59030 [Streptomyces griseomycini]GGR35522.1 hypothetical protein GCM10015536_46510 [Streptomyces griseomycini]
MAGAGDVREHGAGPDETEARALAAGPAARVAATLATAQKAPVAIAVRKRAASSGVKPEPTAM